MSPDFSSSGADESRRPHLRVFRKIGYPRGVSLTNHYFRDTSDNTSMGDNSTGILNLFTHAHPRPACDAPRLCGSPDFPAGRVFQATAARRTRRRAGERGRGCAQDRARAAHRGRHGRGDQFGGGEVARRRAVARKPREGRRRGQGRRVAVQDRSAAGAGGARAGERGIGEGHRRARSGQGAGRPLRAGGEERFHFRRPDAAVFDHVRGGGGGGESRSSQRRRGAADLGLHRYPRPVLGPRRPHPRSGRQSGEGERHECTAHDQSDRADLRQFRGAGRLRRTRAQRAGQGRARRHRARRRSENAAERRTGLRRQRGGSGDEHGQAARAVCQSGRRPVAWPVRQRDPHPRHRCGRDRRARRRGEGWAERLLRFHRESG